MIKNVFYTLFCLIPFSVPCAGQAALDNAPQAEANKVQSPVNSAWLMIEAWEDGEKDEDLNLWLEFKGDKVIAHHEGDLAISKCVIDADKKRMVITTDEEDEINVIYKIENDILTMCHFSEAQGYPENYDIEEGKIVVRLGLMKPTIKNIQGTWHCIEGWDSGEKEDDEEVKDLSVRISDYLFEVFEDGQLQDAAEGDLDPDESFIITLDKKLKRLQLDNQMGEIIKCVYKLENNILTIHFHDTIKEKDEPMAYPKGFKIKEYSVLLKFKKGPVKDDKEDKK